MPYVSDPGKVSQIQEETAIKQAEFEAARYACRCPRCDRFGLVRGHDDHYGIIYQCSCLPVCWAIDPETGEKVEGG